MSFCILRQHSLWDKCLVDSASDKFLLFDLFHRSEIEHLTELMHSRTVDSTVGEGKSTEVVPSDPILPHEQKEEYPKTPALETLNENHIVSTPHVTKVTSTV